MEPINALQDCVRAAFPAFCAVAGGDPHAGEVLRRAYTLSVSWLVFFMAGLPVALALSVVLAHLGARHFAERLLRGK